MPDVVTITSSKLLTLLRDLASDTACARRVKQSGVACGWELCPTETALRLASRIETAPVAVVNDHLNELTR